VSADDKLFEVQADPPYYYVTAVLSSPTPQTSSQARVADSTYVLQPVLQPGWYALVHNGQSDTARDHRKTPK
jgi:hypothetical protein